MLASEFFEDEKKTTKNSSHHCKLHFRDNSISEYEQDQTKLRQWKTVTNELCGAEIGEKSSIKKNFRAKNGTKKLKIVCNVRFLDGLKTIKKMNWFFSLILEN